MTPWSRIARSATTICDPRASGSDATTGGSGRGVAVGSLVVGAGDVDGCGESVGSAAAD